MSDLPSISDIITQLGGDARVAEACGGITPNAVYKWSKWTKDGKGAAVAPNIPPKHFPALIKLSGNGLTFESLHQVNDLAAAKEAV